MLSPLSYREELSSLSYREWELAPSSCPSASDSVRSTTTAVGALEDEETRPRSGFLSAVRSILCIIPLSRRLPSHK